MRKFLSILVSLLFMNASGAFAREKKNAPDKDEVLKVINEMGANWKYTKKVKLLKSIPTEDTYFHIFTSQLKSGANRIVIYNNKKEYLGYYLDIAEPYKVSGDGDESAYVVICRDSNGSSYPIPIGNNGPWEKSLIKKPNYGHDARNNPWKEIVLRFQPSEYYTPPTISSETRSWTFKSEKPIRGRLAMLTEDYIYIQLENEAIQTIPRRYLSKDDQKYLKSIKN